MKNTRLLTIFAILILSLVLTTGVLASASMAGNHKLMNAANPAFSGKSSDETPEPVFLPIILNNYSAPIFYDPFDTDKLWTIISSGGYDYEIYGGEYYITQTIADKIVKSIAPVPSAEIPSQYVIEANMRLPDGSNDETRYGLVFDFVDETHFYVFYVSPKTRNWWIYKYSYPSWSKVDSSISANPNIYQTGNNHLKLERNGDQINAYINEDELGPWSPYSDFTGNQAGLVLISSSSLGGENAVAAYDDFLIKDLYP